MAAKTVVRWFFAILILLHCSGMKGGSLSEETDSHEEDSKEWKESKVDGKETEQEGVVYKQSEVSVDDRVPRSENEEGQVKNDEEVHQTNGIDLGKESEPEGVPSEAAEETAGDPKVSIDVKGPSSNRLQQDRVVTSPVPGKSVNKAPAGHRHGEKKSADIPDLTKQPLEEEEGDDFYKEAVHLMVSGSSYSDKQRAYELLSKALELGNLKAKRKMAYAYLLADRGYVEIDFAKAFQLFTELADVGHPAGQHGLGFMYSLGIGVNASQAKAILYYTFGALGGDPLAQMTMGYRYLSGVNVEQSCESALAYYSRVALSVASELPLITVAPVGKPRVFEEDSQSESSDEFDDDLRQYYELLADKGELQAQLILSQLYMTGMHGVGQDLTKALYHLNQAASEGHAGAYGNIGKIYLQGGHNVPADYETALKYLEEAANLKEGTGLAGLGYMYLKGVGVKQDINKAYTLISQSANKDSVDGHVLMGELLLRGVGTKQNFRNAANHFRMAAQFGYPLTKYYLGFMNSRGLGMARNCPGAVEAYKYVVDGGEWSQLFTDALEEYEAHQFDSSLLKYLFLGELGYEKAQSNAAYILETYILQIMSGEEDNFKRAFMMWKRAASQGYFPARLRIGDYYFYGLGTEVDYQAAVNQYQIASEHLVPQAVFNLGYMHEHGLGLQMDYHLAKRHYDKAAEISPDAEVPVALALMKMNLALYMRQLAQIFRWSTFASIFVGVTAFLGKNWDVYLMTFLTVLVGLIYLIRQNR